MPGPNPPAAADHLREFRDALTANNAATARTAWGQLTADEKKQVKTSGDDLTRMLRVLQLDALPMMKEVGASFATDARMGQAIFWAGGPAPDAWMGSLKTNNLWADFIAADPKRPNMTNQQAARMKVMMDNTADTAEARQVFEKVYPQAADASYGPAFLKTTAWQQDHLKRLYTAIQSFVPVAHAQTLSGGFYLGTHHKIGNPAPAAWQFLDFAWYHNNNCVVPLNSAGANGGGTGHDMSGGSGSGAAEAQKDNKAHMSHFTGSVLHEIGHGVGASNGGAGDNWAAGANSGTPHFGPNMAIDAWSAPLYSDANVKTRYDAAVTAGTAKPAPNDGAGTSPAKLARLWLAAEIKSAGSGALAGLTAPQMIDFVTTYAPAEKLKLYYDHVVTGGADGYNFPNNICVSGSWVYVKLTRGGMDLTKYKKTSYDNKVSWYSLSSAKEWFAEQYNHYYRISPRGKGLPGDVKTKIEEFDKMTIDASGNLTTPAPAPGGGQRGANSSGTDTGGTPEPATPSSGAPDFSEIRRAPFEW